MCDTSPGVVMTAPPRFYPPIDRPSANAARRSPLSVSIRARISMGQRDDVPVVRQLRPKAYDRTESVEMCAEVENAMAGIGPGCQVRPGMKLKRCRRPRTI